MRTFIVAILALLLPSFTLAQQMPLVEGSCVMGVAKMKNGRLVFEHPIPVYRDAADKKPIGVMSHHDSYYVASRVRGNERVKLVLAPGIDLNPGAGEIYGWVEQTDIRVVIDLHCY